jgi:hypothetical protein
VSSWPASPAHVGRERSGVSVGGVGTRLAVERAMATADVVAAVRDWLDAYVPAAWREAAAEGGPASIRAVGGPAHKQGV